MRLLRLPIAVSAVIAAAVFVPAVAFGGAHAARGRTVILKNLRFSPSAVSIGRGQTVTWRWADGGTPHNVISTSGSRFHSSSTKVSGSYTVRFTRAGTYSYVCTIHPGMRGKVIVH